MGLLQFNSSGKATLIPIVIRIDGRFYDASVYKADPVPMALESGTARTADIGGRATTVEATRAILDELG